MNFKEAIDILELPENYSIDILKKNYKRLAVKYHPDKYSGDSSKFSGIIFLVLILSTNSFTNIFPKYEKLLFKNITLSSNVKSGESCINRSLLATIILA
jgi:DnaJ-class molecular chaperone